MGVALTQLHGAGAGKPTFAIGDDEMEMGVGIHGEPGRRRVKLKQADAIAEEMVDGDLQRSQGEGTRPGDRCWSTASAGRRRWSSI